jgi:DNA-directed RNA polymerase specialized sigma subunit
MKKPKTNEEHLNDLLIEYAPLINMHVNKLRDSLPPHIDHEDLYAAGVHGLVDSLHKYDPKKGASFNTYASQRIKGKMLDHVTAPTPSGVDYYHYKQAKDFMKKQPKAEGAPVTTTVMPKTPAIPEE